jgi:hypothetical protein
MLRRNSPRRGRALRTLLLACVIGAALLAALVRTVAAGGAAAPTPTVVRDVKTGRDAIGSLIQPGPDSIQDYIQPDTQTEPSLAVNPANPKNVVAAYQEGRIANGGDATNGYATSFDAGKTWRYGELPGLTAYPGQGGDFERASDAVVAFGPNNTVYANSLVFDQNTDNGLRSGMAVNVSTDGGLHWSAPVFFQDDQLGGLNDKNWIVVDNSSAPGHHYGRVYVVWDRVAPVVYDYCDHDCDQLANWLPNLQVIPQLVFPGQGIGAYPVVLKDGGLGIVMDADSGGIPSSSGQDEPELGLNAKLVFIRAPLAGTTPYPAPLQFLPPQNIATNMGAVIPAQRAGSLPAAAVDPDSGAIYATWEDSRYRSDGKNDAVISSSTDNGLTWTPPLRLNGGLPTDKVDHYNVSVAVGDNGSVHVAYRQRDESAAGPLYTDVIDTYYQESVDGGTTWSAPLKVNREASNPWWGAFSRDGTFEGDYNEIASAGGYTYIVRCQGHKDGAQPLVANPDGSNTLVLTEAGKGNQHQYNWVALVQNKR